MKYSYYFKLFLICLLAFLVIFEMQINGSVIFDVAYQFIQFPSSSYLIYACLLYIILLSIPYVPGLELGILLMIYYGEPGIAAVYISTVIGLNLSFAIGRITSKYIKNNQCDDREKTNESLWEKVITQNKILSNGMKVFLEQYIHQHKYLTIAVLLNLPGNWIIGGGGGISLVSGCYNSTSWFRFSLTVIFATSLFPLLVFFGMISLKSFI